jgi:hypothetical protein
MRKREEKGKKKERVCGGDEGVYMGRGRGAVVVVCTW